MTPYEELRKKFKLELQTDETFEHFAKRATDKVNKANDDEWRELSEGLQNWVNSTLKAREAKEEVPELQGFPEPEASTEGDDAEADATGDDATDDGDAEQGRVPDVADGEPVPEEPVDAAADSEEEESSTEAEAQPVSTRRKGKSADKRPKPAKAKTTTAAKPPNSKQGKAKVMPTKTATKVAKKATTNGGGHRIADEDKIKIVAKENPHRSGTKLYNYFKKYKDGMTVAAAKKAGIPPKNIAYLASQDLIKVVAA